MSAGPGELPLQPAQLDARLADKILDAAAERFIMAGVKHTTIADVARSAGVSEQAILSTWRNTATLMTAVVVRDLRTRRDELTEAVQSLDRLDDQIAEGFASVLWFLDSHPLVGGSVRSDAEMILPLAEVSISPVVGLGVDAINDYISAAVFNGLGRSVDTDALAEVLTRLIQSLLLTRGPSAPLRNRKELVHYAHQCIVPFVRAFIR